MRQDIAIEDEGLRITTFCENIHGLDRVGENFEKNWKREKSTGRPGEIEN